MQIQDKVIAITGAGQGLGKAMALTLASQGAKLALVDRNADALERAVAECRKLGVRAEGYIADIANEGEVENLFARIETAFGGVDALVNNAGIIRDGLLVKAKDGVIEGKLSLSDWQKVIDVNLTGVFLCGREAAAQMVQKGRPGVIVNISSISRNGNMGQSNYAAAKAGVAAMTVTWAKELARYGIRCAAIAPGFIATDMTASMKPEVIAKIESGIPLRKMGLPENIAQTVKFILENDYLTGRVLEIDGGLRL
ncbi:SDR family oxidoreductase [Permianibacter sp. IMCC34836]|uniref:SDR family oxidoreductase n=1 Tax=Permianibacter fluminis TaxID=2738515 RepID=UPI0015532BE3|nr:SDR family oxidoreductase [Permianibacter fluminis]NQD37121.1 SDR family oxidoreductase [Permianibacter fluminis]